MRSVLIWTVILVTLALLHLSHAAEFSCATGDVTCLRAAINAANTNGEAQTLTLEVGTYTVTEVDSLTDGANGLPSIHGTLTIRSAAPPTAVAREVSPSHAPEEVLLTRAMPPAIVERAAGAPFFRLFHVAATGILTLDGLTLAGGNIVGEGGGLLNRGRVVLRHSTLTDNAANYGGGLSNEGALTITDSTIIHSRAHAGAGILNRGTLTVINTTIADNAANEGGGVANLGRGPVVITNATVARNSASGIFGGGGIANLGSGTVALQNTILALNTAPGVLGPDCFGRIISRGHNLIGDTADCTIQRRANDLVGDPDLGAFADDGASGHVYVPLLPVSRAIDAGDSAACPPTDQLGHPRFNVCDIGAVECTPPGCMRTSPSRYNR
jgi:Right handed beta helix region